MNGGRNPTLDGGVGQPCDAIAVQPGDSGTFHEAQIRVRRREPVGRAQTHRGCAVRQGGMTRESGCGRRTTTTDRRRSRPDTGPNRQVHSSVEPHTRTTGYGCRASMARLIRLVDTASALTGTADAGHWPPLSMRPLPGAGRRVPPLRSRPDLLRWRLLTGLPPRSPARGWPTLSAQSSRPLCACRTDASLSPAPQ